MIFAKLAISHETSFKNCNFGNAASCREILQNIVKIELSPTWEAQNDIFDISEKSIFSMLQNCEIVLSPRRESKFYDTSTLQIILLCFNPFS